MSGKPAASPLEHVRRQQSRVAFPLSQLGYGSLHALSITLVLPAAAALLAAWGLLVWCGQRGLAALLSRSALAGTLATLALEAVR